MNRTLASILIAAALGACSKRPDPPPPVAKPAAPAAAATAPKASPPPADPTDPDDAYFVSSNKALWRVHASTVTPVSFSARCGHIRGIYQPKANAAWVDCEYDGFFILAGSRALAAPRPDGAANGALVLGGDGSLWTAPYKATSLYRLEGATWKAEALPDELRGGAEHLSFTVDAKGRVYLANVTNGWLREGTTWQPMPLPADKQRRYPPHFIATEDGAVFMMVGYRWTEFTDGKVGRRGYHNFENPVPRLGGGVVIGHEQRVSVIAADGKVERSVSFAKGAVGWRAGDGQSVAVDGRGRVWVATQYGLVTIDERGAVEQWEPGRIDGFDTTDVTLVVVGGKGPELPALGPRVRGEVVGRVIGVKPGATLEMCTGSTGFSTGIGPGTFYGRTPCDGNPFRFRAKLDGEGRFRFTGVPPLPMSAVVQVSSRDWTRRKSGCCSRLRPGAPLELEL